MTIDFDVYFRTLRALNEHDGSGSLTRVRAPALVVTGSRDLLLPPRVAREAEDRGRRNPHFRSLSGTNARSSGPV